MSDSNQACQKPVAVITGAASGLGRDIARELAGEYHLVLIDIQEEGLRRVSTELSQADTVVSDLSSASDIHALIATLTTAYDSIELLINNAGITHRSLASVTQLTVIQKVMHIDYLAPVQLTQGLLPHMSGNATVINIGSMAGWMPVLGRAGYCAAKSALHQYFETLRAELGKQAPHILMVYPSFLDTPIERNALDGTGDNARHKRTVTGRLRSSQWMAAQIVTALKKKRQRLFPERFTHLASLLYRFCPSLYLHLMRKKLQRELDTPV